MYFILINSLLARLFGQSYYSLYYISDRQKPAQSGVKLYAMWLIAQIKTKNPNPLKQNGPDYFGAR